MKRSVSIIIFILSSCVAEKNKINLEEMLGAKITEVDRVFYKKLNIMPDYEYPYLILAKVEYDSAKAVAFIRRIGLQKFSEIEINSKLNGVDFSSNSFWRLSSIVKGSLEYPDWWSPDLENLSNNFGSFYNCQNIDKIVSEKKSWNGRVIAQYFKGNLYFLTECYPTYSP